jgi:hypothetical protein
MAAVVAPGLASPAAASTSALPIGDNVVDVEEALQPRRARVARQSADGHRAVGTIGEIRERSTVRWLRPVVRSLRSVCSARPRSTRGPPPRLAFA